MLQRNLLYTGITRGKRLVVLAGQKKAVAIAVRNVSGRRRAPAVARAFIRATTTGSEGEQPPQVSLGRLGMLGGQPRFRYWRSTAPPYRAVAEIRFYRGTRIGRR